MICSHISITLIFRISLIWIGSLIFAMGEMHQTAPWFNAVVTSQLKIQMH